MLLRRLYQLVIYTRTALYSAVSSPGCGITWSIVTFLSGVLYLIYHERTQHNVGAARKEVLPSLKIAVKRRQAVTRLR
jgi:hypothetical protein